MKITCGNAWTASWIKRRKTSRLFAWMTTHWRLSAILEEYAFRDDGIVVINKTMGMRTSTISESVLKQRKQKNGQYIWNGVVYQSKIQRIILPKCFLSGSFCLMNSLFDKKSAVPVGVSRVVVYVPISQTKGSFMNCLVSGYRSCLQRWDIFRAGSEYSKAKPYAILRLFCVDDGSTDKFRDRSSRVIVSGMRGSAWWRKQ